MKKFGLVIVGIIAAVVMLANLGPMLGLAITSVILYFVFKEFIKAKSTGKKVLWLVIGFITLSLSNATALIGILAAYVLFVVYKKWNNEEKVIKEEEDPFTSFEKEWSEINKY